MLQAAAGSLSPRLCSHTRPISQTGTAEVILLRMDVVIVRLDVHLASRFAASTRGLEQEETMGREFLVALWERGWWGECLFLALKR